MSISACMRSFLIAAGLLVSCGGPRSAPSLLAGSGGTPVPGAPPAFDGGTPDAGSLDDGVTDAGSVDAGVADAGTLDGGLVDAGTADAGADAGRAATIDCAPFGAARLAWTLTGYQNPWNTYDANSYFPLATDTLDGVLVGHVVLQGHEGGESDSTYDPDGGLRATGAGGWYCHPTLGCSYYWSVISDGTIYGAGGIARSAQDGHTIYWLDPVLPGADAGAQWEADRVAANGGIGVVTWTNYQAPATSTVIAADGDGGTLWQHTFPQVADSVAVDDTGVTLVQMEFSGDLLAFARDGHELYSQTTTGCSLQAAGGRFSLGSSTLYSVADGSRLSTPTIPAGKSLLLTASRMYLWNYDTSTGLSRVIAVDPATGNMLWEHALRANSWDTSVPFSVTGERAVIIDPENVLHVLQADDGTDLLACKVATDVSRPVLLRGGRLAVRRYPNLEVYDLPY